MAIHLRHSSAEVFKMFQLNPRSEGKRWVRDDSNNTLRKGTSYVLGLLFIFVAEVLCGVKFVCRRKLLRSCRGVCWYFSDFKGVD